MGAASAGASSIRLERGRIVCSVRGQHTAEDATICAREMFRLLAPLESAELIVELATSSGFSPAARDIWSERLREFKRRIQIVTLVEGNPLAAMTVSTLCLYVGIATRTAASVADALARPLPPQ